MWEYLKILNPVLNLTHRELEVFLLLLKYELEVNQNLRKECSPTELRKLIMSDTSINKNNLTKYINLFEEKQLITKDRETGIVKVNEILLPFKEDNEVEVTYVLNIE